MTAPPYSRAAGRIVLYPDDPGARQTWPDPTSEQVTEARHRAAYLPGMVTREDLLHLCAVCDAYQAIVMAPAGVVYRDRVLRSLRRACLDAQGQAGGEG